MLNEPASSLDDYPKLRQRTQSPPETEAQETDTTFSEIHTAVESVMAISGKDVYQDEDSRPQIMSLFFLSRESRVLATFTGTLAMDSEAAYTKLDTLLRPYDMVPVFRNADSVITAAPHLIHVVKGRIRPNAGGNMLSLTLLMLTIFSVLFVGAIQALGEIHAEDPVRAEDLAQNLGGQLWRGWPYALSILLILGAHEMGHYLMARRHKIAASLPYFLPFPFNGFGTLGAAIRLREPFRNRKMMMDVGAAGPLAGMIFALPIVLLGLATSEVDSVGSGMVEGNSILYALSKILVFGRFLPDGEVDVYVNQLAWAGWIGMLVTGLNLIPVGQLDGGHVLYSLLGNNAKRLYYPIVGVLVLLMMTVANVLVLFVVLILFLGNRHAVPLDDITPLDNRRQLVAIFTLVLFVLVFVPIPLTQVAEVASEEGPPPGRDLIMLPVLFASLWLGRRRFYRR